MKYIIDVQGYKTTVNEFIFKEVAIVPLEEEPVPSVFLFKPPFPWSSGYIPYEDVGRVLRTVLDYAEAVYVKGLEKSKWLKRILPDRLVLNIEDIGCPSLQKMADFTPCSHHLVSLNPACAVRNAHAMKRWMLERDASTSMYN